MDGNISWNPAQVGMIHMYGTTNAPTITNNTISNSNYVGIRVFYSTPIISNNVFSNNKDGDILID